jgi:hypothetical protein
VIAVTAIAFLVLVSISASHLHITADADDACAVCTAFAGKLDTPDTDVPTVAPVAIDYVVCAATPRDDVLPPAPHYILPPTCGPPHLG